MSDSRRKWADYQSEHFQWRVDDRVGTITLNRPERKNPLTFESYAEMRDLFHGLRYAEDVRALIVTGAGGNFCSGGDVHEIIGPLMKMSMRKLLDFTRMTGDLVKAMRTRPQPTIAAVDGVCAGAGAILALASDFRYATPEAKAAFLFCRVGLAGCDMGACSFLPRLIGQGRAAELLYTGRSFSAAEGERWGYFNALLPREDLLPQVRVLAGEIAAGPTFAHAMTKNMLNQEWGMSLEQAVESEAQAQAICMQTEDFRHTYRAFVNRDKPVFEGN